MNDAQGEQHVAEYNAVENMARDDAEFTRCDLTTLRDEPESMDKIALEGVAQLRWISSTLVDIAASLRIIAGK